MGTVYAEITLKNAIDVGSIQRGLIKAQDFRVEGRDRHGTGSLSSQARGTGKNAKGGDLTK